MDRWEYEFLFKRVSEFESEDSTNEVKQSLNRWGYLGWELVSVMPISRDGGSLSKGFAADTIWVFKRRK
jgi:hypothetical protein